MADPTDIAVENIAYRTLDIKILRSAIKERLEAFAAFAEYEFFNYIGTEGNDAIVAEILELKAPKSVIMAYQGSEYGYSPMARRDFVIFVALQNTKLYTPDFSVDPLSDSVSAVILALDKWSPGDHCRVMVTGDDPIDVSQAMSAAMVKLAVEDE